MPIYEYQCGTCQEKTEKLQKMSDAPLVTCPHCHAEALTRLVSAAGFQLKGTGWYVTDFRDNGKKPPEKNNKTKNETTKITETKKDTKATTEGKSSS